MLPSCRGFRSSRSQFPVTPIPCSALVLDAVMLGLFSGRGEARKESAGDKEVEEARAVHNRGQLSTEAESTIKDLTARVSLLTRRSEACGRVGIKCFTLSAVRLLQKATLKELYTRTSDELRNNSPACFETGSALLAGPRARAPVAARSPADASTCRSSKTRFKKPKSYWRGRGAAVRYLSTGQHRVSAPFSCSSSKTGTFE